MARLVSWSLAAGVGVGLALFALGEVVPGIYGGRPSAFVSGQTTAAWLKLQEPVPPQLLNQELDSVYDRIAEEMRTQYSLGYVPTNLRKDGHYRRIVVRVPSRDNVVLRYKLGYFGPRA